MGARDNLQRLVDRKQQELAELEAQSREAKVYIQALLDAMKSLPRESFHASPADALRPETIGYRARKFILEAGKPLHVNDILSKLARPVDKANRVSVSGTLSAFVRNGEIFTRPAPNTFGLAEMGFNGTTPNADEDDLPEDFGK